MKSESVSFTPGPWTIHDNIGKRGDLGILADTAPCIVAIMGNTRAWPAEAAANARLIAAAPELLSACREAQDWIYQAGLHGYDAYSANYIIAKLANIAYEATQAHHGSEVCK